MIFWIKKRLKCNRDCHYRKIYGFKKKGETIAFSSVDLFINKEDNPRYQYQDNGPHGEDKVACKIVGHGNIHI